MEKRLSYIVVGAFMIVLTLSLFSFLYWLARYGDESVQHDYYHTYFTESVSGLSVESLVKYRGVEVGNVKGISINKQNSEEVEILLEIKKGTPIKKDTYAELGSQGITGLKYIELKGGDKNSPLLKRKKGEIPTIKSKVSVLASLFDNSKIITQKINGVLDKIGNLLSEKNIENFDNIVKNLSNTTSYIDKNRDKIGKMFEQISDLKKNIQKDLEVITENITSFSADGKKFLNHTVVFEDALMPSFKKLGEMGEKAGAASDATKLFFNDMTTQLKNGQFDFSDIVEQNMQVLNETALSLRSLSIKLDEMVNELKDSPSNILFKSTKKIPGPGESHE